VEEENINTIFTMFLRVDHLYFLGDSVGDVCPLKCTDGNGDFFSPLLSSFPPGPVSCYFK